MKAGGSQDSLEAQQRLIRLHRIQPVEAMPGDDLVRQHTSRECWTCCICATQGHIPHLSHSFAHIERVEVSPVKGVHPIPPVLLIMARILCGKGTGSGSQMCTPYLHPPQARCCLALLSATF